MLEIARTINRALPLPLRHAILVRRRARLWRQAGIVFVHIPKAAGTSLNHLLYGQFMGHARASDIRRWAPPDVAQLPMFGITRNPWDRLVSAYRFASSGRGFGGRVVATMRNPEQYRTPEFESFERFVLEWLKPRDLRTLDGVFRPQWSFVSQNDKLIVDHIGKVEDPESTYSFIQRHYGAIGKIPVTNTSGAKVNYMDFYDDRLRSVVGSIYQEDVDRFKYTFHPG